MGINMLIYNLKKETSVYIFIFMKERNTFMKECKDMSTDINMSLDKSFIHYLKKEKRLFVQDLSEYIILHST